MTDMHSIEIQVAAGVTAFGEVSQLQDARGVVLLLHGRGSDLDCVRPFTAPLQHLLLDTLSIDMPGHGLSSGSWDEHGERAVALALSECHRRSSNVAVVAVGSSARVLFGLPQQEAHALALVQPTLSAEDLDRASSWRSVPQIAMGDTDDAATSDSMELLRKWVRAWSMRLHVHFGDPMSATAPWTEHMVHSGAAFIAEQLAYRSLGRAAVTSLAADK